MKSWLLMLVGLILCAGCAGSSTDHKYIKAADVLDKIIDGEDVVFSEKHIVGDLDFFNAGNGLKITSLAHSRIQSEIMFVDCVFEGEVRMSGSLEVANQIVACDFLSDVSFVGCTFMKDVNMSQARFRGRLEIMQCVMREGMTMDGARCEGGLVMNKTEVWGRWMACGTTFGDGTSMKSCQWKQDMIMQRSRMVGGAMMADSKMGGYVDLSGLRVEGDMNIANCQLTGRVEMREGWLGGKVNMAKARFMNNVTIENVVVLGQIEMRGTRFDKGGTVRGSHLLTMPESGDRDIAASETDEITQ